MPSKRELRAARLVDSQTSAIVLLRLIRDRLAEAEAQMLEANRDACRLLYPTDTLSDLEPRHKPAA